MPDGMVRLGCSGDVSHTAQLSPAQLSSQPGPAQPKAGGKPKPARVFNFAKARRYGAIGLLGRRLPYSPAQPRPAHLTAQPSSAHRGESEASQSLRVREGPMVTAFPRGLFAPRLLPRGALRFWLEAETFPVIEGIIIKHYLDHS